MRTKFPNQANEQGRGGALRPPLRCARAFPPKYGRDLSAGERQRLAVVCALAVLLAIVSVTRAAHAPAPVTEPQFVKSVFVKAPNPGSGKDPFFPKSTRFGALQTNTTEVAPTPVSCLMLKGISGSKGHRLAIINNRTFEAGEEAEIRAAGQTFRVKCVDIRDDGVTVSVSGQTQKLSLGPKL